MESRRQVCLPTLGAMRTASKAPQKKMMKGGNLQVRIPTLREYGFLLALRKQIELREETGSRAQSH